MSEERKEIIQDNKKWRCGIFAVVVVLIVLVVGIGIYNTPENRLQRQLNLGNKYLEEQQYEEAVLAFDRAIAIDEACVEAYLGKAEAYIGLEDYEMVVDQMQICFQLTGDGRYWDQILKIKQEHSEAFADSAERKSEESSVETDERQEEIEEQPIPEWSEEAAHRAYEVVLQQYQKIIELTPKEWNRDAERYLAQFPDLQRAVMDDYFTPTHYDAMIGGDEPCELAYSYYDIDYNGIPELILWHLHHEATIFEIYVYNGLDAVALNLGETSEDIYYPYNIYDDGTIWIYHDDSEYYRFHDDGYSVERVYLSQEEIEKVVSQNILSGEIGWTIFAHDIDPIVTDSDLSESDMNTIFREKIGVLSEIYFFYDDFDGDGINEAYGITGEYSEADELYTEVMIYYISPDGSCYCMTEYDDVYGYLTLTRDESEEKLLQVGKRKFLLWELSANGSGSLTYVFGADKGIPYEPNISRNYMCFGMKSAYLTDEDTTIPDADTYVGYTNDFSQGYHDYAPHYFVFDEEELQFMEN